MLSLALVVPVCALSRRHILVVLVITLSRRIFAILLTLILRITIAVVMILIAVLVLRIIAILALIVTFMRSPKQRLPTIRALIRARLLAIHPSLQARRAKDVMAAAFARETRGRMFVLVERIMANAALADDVDLVRKEGLFGG
jgi:hypothetical protein